MMRSARQAFLLLSPALRLRWMGLIPLAVAVALLETLAVAAIFVLVRLIDDPSVADYSRFVALLQPVLPQAGNRAGLLTALALVVVVLYLAKNAIRLSGIWARQKLIRDATIYLVDQLARRYLHGPYSFHLQHKPTELMRNLQTSAPTVATHIYESTSVILSESLVILGIAVVIVHSAPAEALGGMAIVVALMMAFLWLTQRRHKRWGDAVHQAGEQMNGALLNMVQGIKEIKVLGEENFFADELHRHRTTLSDLGMRRTVLANLPHLIVETFFIVAIALMVLLLAGREPLETRLLPLLGLFAYAGLRILPSLHWIVYHSNNLRFATAPLEEIREHWQLAPEASTPSATPGLAEKAGIRFAGVSFRYPGAAKPALRDVDHEIPYGQTVGVVGRSGAGKTTFADLLLGILSPSEGRILVNGSGLEEIGGAWRGQVGYVPQHGFLVDDSVTRNIALGEPGLSPDAERVEKAVKLAQLDHWIQHLPNGLDTPIGDRGIRLSGGERQRLAVARALYRNPQVLVFDEATSSLDYETEAALASAINAVHGHKTVIIIAHRLSTVRQCDQILFFDEGRLAGCGRYDDLMAGNPKFRELAEAGALW